MYYRPKQMTREANNVLVWRHSDQGTTYRRLPPKTEVVQIWARFSHIRCEFPFSFHCEFPKELFSSSAAILDAPQMQSFGAGGQRCL